MILSGIIDRLLRRLGLAAFIAMLLMANWHAAGAQGDDPVAATINGEPITRTEILLALELLPAKFRNLPPRQLFPLIRDQLIDIKLLAAKGAEAGLRDDPRITARRDFYAMRLLHDYYARDIVNKHLSEELLRESYEKFVQTFLKDEELKISHILVSAEEEAEKIVAELKAGADFATTARKYSLGPSAPKGGELGFLRREQVVPEFAELAFSLEDGEFAGPVKTQFGWHVIMVWERRTPEPPGFSEVKQKLRAEIADRLVSKAAKEARASVAIEKFDMDEDFFAGVTVAP